MEKYFLTFQEIADVSGGKWINPPAQFSLESVLTLFIPESMPGGFIHLPPDASAIS